MPQEQVWAAVQASAAVVPVLWAEPTQERVLALGHDRSHRGEQRIGHLAAQTALLRAVRGKPSHPKASSEHTPSDSLRRLAASWCVRGACLTLRAFCLLCLAGSKVTRKSALPQCSAGFPACCTADFQSAARPHTDQPDFSPGRRSAPSRPETCGTADSKVRATAV